MAYRKISVPSPDEKGGMVPAEDIPVVESVERWSEIRLADGTVFRAKISIASVARVIGKTDDDGNPVYYLNAQPSVAMVTYGTDADTGEE